MTNAWTRGYYRGLWLASFPLLPVLAVQGKAVQRDTPLLPEAEGPRAGTVGNGERKSSLAVLGESTAAGVGVETQDDGIAAQLAKRVASRIGSVVRWQAVGRTGLTVSGMRRKLVDQLDGPVDVVVVLAGVNDVVRMTPEQKWVRGVRALTEALRERGARRVVFPSVAPVGAFPALPRPLRDVMGVRASLLDHSLRYALEDVEGASYSETIFPTERQYMAADGFHPSSLGYSGWADQLLDHLASLPGFRPGGESREPATELDALG